MLELGRALGEQGDGAFEQHDALVAIRAACERAQACAERCGRSDLLGERHVPLGVPTCLGGVSERDERLGGSGAPRGHPGMDVPELVPARTRVEGVRERLGGPMLGETQPRATLQQQR